MNIVSKFSVLAAAALFGNLALSATATAAEIRCDACTESTYQQRAKNANLGTHYVYDLVNNQARKYFVERERAPNGTYLYFVDPLPVENDVTRVVNEMSSIYRSTGGTMRAKLTVTADGSIAGMSAFNGALAGGSRTAIISWFQNSLSVQNVLPFLGVAVNGLGNAAVNVWKNVPIKTLVTIKFADGTTMTVDVNMLDRTVTVVECMDAAGNPIPTSASQATSIRFDFTRDPTNRAPNLMWDWLGRLGVSVTGSGSHGLACSESSAGIVCVKY
jgi:hypothetical protein